MSNQLRYYVIHYKRGEDSKRSKRLIAENEPRTYREAEARMDELRELGYINIVAKEVKKNGVRD